jgi:NAD(P)-dependent dehydrogenase (short-subunit alcohol dehydrogenase family)
VAVNCAGIDHILPVEDLSVEQFDRVISINLRGPFLAAKAVFPATRRQGGDIINIASTAAVRAWAHASAYHASKWGLRGLSRGLSVEGRADNIRVTTVIPGGMRTGWFETFPEQNIPLPDPSTLQDPANVAGAILLAVSMPADSAVQEIVVTPPGEPSWP